jgi:hypothetical protein
MLLIAHVNPRIVGVAWHQRRQQSMAATSFVEIAMQIARDIEESNDWSRADQQAPEIIDAED